MLNVWPRLWGPSYGSAWEFLPTGKNPQGGFTRSGTELRLLTAIKGGHHPAAQGTAWGWRPLQHRLLPGGRSSPGAQGSAGGHRTGSHTARGHHAGHSPTFTAINETLVIPNLCRQVQAS